MRMTDTKLREFSKKIIVISMIVYFIGVIFGIYVIGVELYISIHTIDLYGVTYNIHIAELLTYMAAVPTGGVTLYMCKSAFENRAKIMKNAEMEAYEEI